MVCVCEVCGGGSLSLIIIEFNSRCKKFEEKTMGRQIRFWAIQKDYEELSEILIQNDIIVLTRSGNRLEPSSKKFYTVFGAEQCFLTKEGLRLPYDENKNVDRWNSEVVEFANCRPSKLKISDPSGCKLIRTGYEHGRLWYDPYFRDDSYNETAKCKELTAMYNLLKRYIQKNYRISKCKCGYIGPYAYEEYMKDNFIPCSGKNRIEF